MQNPQRSPVSTQDAAKEPDVPTPKRSPILIIVLVAILVVPILIFLLGIAALSGDTADRFREDTPKAVRDKTAGTSRPGIIPEKHAPIDTTNAARATARTAVKPGTVIQKPAHAR